MQVTEAHASLQKSLTEMKQTVSTLISEKGTKLVITPRNEILLLQESLTLQGTMPKQRDCV